MSEESVLQMKLTERKGVLGQSFVRALARATALREKCRENYKEPVLWACKEHLLKNAQSDLY